MSEQDPNARSAEWISSEETLDAKVRRLERRVAALERRERLLAEENLRLADLLKDNGVEVHVSSHLTRELPEAAEKPLPADDTAFSHMTEAERALFGEASEGQDAFVLVKTGSEVDVGSWVARGQAWACAMADDLMLFASGRRPYVQRIPYRQLRESLYNHVTGSIAMAPVREAELQTLKVTPAEGYQLLAQIYKDVEKETSNA
jgi:hypothetical protein